MHYMSFIFFFFFISVAYSQYCPTTNKQSKCQTIKCFIYYYFINHNSQSNTLAKTIYKSQPTSHFVNSDNPTHQLHKKKKKKNFETDKDSQSPNTIKYSNSIHNHPLPKKTHTHTHTIRDSYIILSQKKKKKQHNQSITDSQHKHYVNVMLGFEV